MVFLQHHEALEARGLATRAVYAVDHMAPLLLLHEQDIKHLRERQRNEYEILQEIFQCVTPRTKKSSKYLLKLRKRTFYREIHSLSALPRPHKHRNNEMLHWDCVRGTWSRGHTVSRSPMTNTPGGVRASSSP